MDEKYLKNIVSAINDKNKDSDKFFDKKRYEYLFEFYPPSDEDLDSYNNDTYLSIMKVLEFQSYKCSYAYILHDKDFYLNDTFNSNYELVGTKGDYKKPHYHLVIKFHTPYSINELETNIGIKRQFIKVCNSFDSSLLYLTHRNKPNKFQYDIKEINSNITDYINYVYSNFNTNDSALGLCLQLLNSDEFLEKKLSFKTFTNLYMMKEDKILQEYRKDFSIIRELIKEHNSYIEFEYSTIQQEVEDRYSKKIDDIITLNKSQVAAVKKVYQHLELSAEQFGSVKFESNNKNYMLVKLDDKKKGSK